ncbi:hypothetical protein GFD30_12860 [Glycomyces sp. NEAU-7082]|uniref:Lipase n=2 Tax=Glycomyces albidus TaxID=2656774 RepID=A0A6L5G9Y4_9ACTN|nr:hypothetical protein [Glycomyces albidus]
MRASARLASPSRRSMLGLRPSRAARFLGLVLAACLTLLGFGVPHAASAHQGPPPGSPTEFSWLPDHLRLDGAGLAWRVEYTSTSFDGTRNIVGGTITFPSGRPPAGGWPIAALLPGASGTAEQCAPSIAGNPPFATPLLESLLAAGWAVAETDYEGVSTPGPNPGIHGPSEAYSAIDLVRVAQHIGIASRTWAAVGYSQGGHGALHTSALAADYAPELDHVGTIAIAPVTQLQLLLSAPADDPGFPVNVFMPYFGAALAATHPGQYQPADWFTPAGLALVAAAGERCTEQMAAQTAALTNADVFTDAPAAMAQMRELLAAQEIPTAGHTEPIRIVHGTTDGLPWQFTELTAAQLEGGGADVEFVPLTGEDHFSVLAAAEPMVLDWLAAFLE